LSRRSYRLTSRGGQQDSRRLTPSGVAAFPQISELPPREYEKRVVLWACAAWMRLPPSTFAQSAQNRFPDVIIVPQTSHALCCFRFGSISGTSLPWPTNAFVASAECLRRAHRCQTAEAEGVSACHAKNKQVVMSGRIERLKTSEDFDGTTHNSSSMVDAIRVATFIFIISLHLATNRLRRNVILLAKRPRSVGPFLFPAQRITRRMASAKQIAANRANGVSKRSSYFCPTPKREKSAQAF
jgi:hypothetical protein